MDLSINAVFVHEGTQVTIALLFLNFFELLHDVVGAFLEAHVTCRGPHEAHSGQVVSCNVTRELPTRAVPSTVTFRFRFQAGALT